ncbi:hypothetical protein GCM10007304_00070 [Rhodococcoides trifolii]|uniref:HEAT repeat domain-containing protein n=1 Tax=Rhodococcoides trifolii TaxID=908250 RepID=A0A917CLH1_9NOCA|nr:HEAT repeat domain-containing protein [Rhodococcus trifolii]GGF90183.1 hypothetical protein GCM10007304_00070 [Rhodococcus trifolii]
MTLVQALSAPDSSVRLRAALAAGTDPDPAIVVPLVERCGTEPDFFVRDMLTWALTRFPTETTVPLLVAELRSHHAQARSQALHSLSKIGETSAWPAITRTLLHDEDDEVARAAWRAAVALAPAAGHQQLADDLASQLGRGNREVHRSLSRALVSLGDVAEPAVSTATTSDDPQTRAHARATHMLLRDPDAGFDSLLDEALRSC